jgi:Holliday junction resolvasome RuvABC ATP-dependent DNA helicase subunit
MHFLTNRVRLKQFREEIAVIHESASKVLCISLTAPVALGNVVGGAVIADHMRMIYRKIIGPVLELCHRIAARFHNFTHQPICFLDCRTWIINKVSLITAPEFGVPLSIAFR